MKINKITIQAFRGFPKKITISFSSTVTIFSAPNGSGKTSISEAFEWALFGEVARRERSRTTGEFGRGFSFLRSVHAEEEDETFVEVEVEHVGTKYLIKRVLNGVDTKLFLDGTEVLSLESIGILTETSSKPCLGQSEIKAFIDTPPIERWGQISAILGLDEFGLIRSKLQSSRNEIDSDERVKRLKNIVVSVASPFVVEGNDPLLIDPDELLTDLSKKLSLVGKSSWDEVKERALAKIKTLINKDKKPKGFDKLANDTEEVDVEPLLTLIRGEFKGLPVHRKLHEKNSQARFITDGLKIARPPLCPFCGENTLSVDKIGKLSRPASESPEDESSKKLNEIRDSFYGIKTMALRSVPEELIASLIDALPEDFLKKEKLDTLIETQKALHEKTVKLDTLVSGLITKMRPSGSDPIDEIETVVIDCTSELEKLATAYQGFWSDCKEVKQAAEILLSGLDERERAALSYLQAMVNVSDKSASLYKNYKLNQLNKDISELIVKLESKEKDLVAKNLADLAVDVIRYYSQINKDSTLEFKGFQVKDGVRRQASLEATSYGVPVNPTSMFSEAQSNGLGLSLYFSQRVDRNPLWESIMLDDPVQSMDEAHKEDLISLLGTLSESKQVIVFTHDRSFRESLEHEFSRHEDMIKYTISKNITSPSPNITIDKAKFVRLTEHALSLSDGDEIQLENSCNTMRSAVERLIDDFSIVRGMNPPRRGTIEEKINSLSTDSTKKAKLHRARSYGTRGSHDTSSPITGSGIKTVLGELKAVYVDLVEGYENITNSKK